MTKLIVSGSREIDSKELVFFVLDDACSKGFVPNLQLVITGGARGVDTLADQWATLRGIDRLIVPAG